MLKTLLNKYERIVYAQLSAVCGRLGAEVHAKVRLADVLPIEAPGLGLSAILFSFALKAHYDFLVTRQDKVPLFAVEFDGDPRDQEAARRDAYKDDLSRRCNLPLHRLCSKDLHAAESEHDALTERIEQWFEGAGTDMRVQPRWVCPICGRNMIERHGKYGRFLGCVGYPPCRGVLQLPKHLRRTHAGPWKMALIVGSIMAALVVLFVTVTPLLRSEHDSQRDDSRPQPLDREMKRGVVATGSSMTLPEKQAYVKALRQSDYPRCPCCGSRMVLRENRKTGEPFFGCSKYPACDCTRSVQYPR